MSGSRCWRSLILALALWHTPDAWADFVALAQRS
jgi:hypothetical protein